MKDTILNNRLKKMEHKSAMDISAVLPAVNKLSLNEDELGLDEPHVEPTLPNDVEITIRVVKFADDKKTITEVIGEVKESVKLLKQSKLLNSIFIDLVKEIAFGKPNPENPKQNLQLTSDEIKKLHIINLDSERISYDSLSLVIEYMRAFPEPQMFQQEDIQEWETWKVKTYKTLPPSPFPRGNLERAFNKSTSEFAMKFFNNMNRNKYNKMLEHVMYLDFNELFHIMCALVAWFIRNAIQNKFKEDSPEFVAELKRINNPHDEDVYIFE